MHPTYKHVRKKTMIIGTVAVGIGFCGAILPFLPGTLFFLTGLSLLSLQSKTAFHLLAKLRARYPKLTNSIKEAEMKLADFFDLTTHKREHLTINKNNSDLSVLVEHTKIEAGVAVLLHGASGTSETKVMETLAEAFRVRGFTVVRFNAFNGLGESDGNFANFTATDYKKDLELVLAWARTQPWWNDTLVLCGHSVGGLVAGLYAALHNKEVHDLVLLSPTVSGTSYKHTFTEHAPEEMVAWSTNGTRTITHPLTREPYEFPYTFVEDLLQYDLMTHATELTMPVTALVGTDDTVAPREDTEAFCTSVGKHATLVPMQHVHHTPETHTELATLHSTLQKIRLRSDHY